MNDNTTPRGNAAGPTAAQLLQSIFDHWCYQGELRMSEYADAHMLVAYYGGVPAHHPETSTRAALDAGWTAYRLPCGEFLAISAVGDQAKYLPTPVLS